MNNSINRTLNQIYQDVLQATDKLSVLKHHPTLKVGISQNCLTEILKTGVKPFDYFVLPAEQFFKRYGFHKQYPISYFPSNEALLADFSLANLKAQASVLTTSKDDNSAIYYFNDLYLTPESVIAQFFASTQLDKSKGWDPCASDGRWLGEKGYSSDIIPTARFVHQGDFFAYEKAPKDTTYIVGNLPFNSLDAFVTHALDLVDDAYFLVSGETIFQHFPENIKEIWLFQGLDGKQKDYRTRCEFQAPYLVQTALWCLIVHLTKNKTKPLILQEHLNKEEQRDGKHVAVGKSAYLYFPEGPEKDARVHFIDVQASIDYKGFKKLKLEDGTIINLADLRQLVF